MRTRLPLVALAGLLLAADAHAQPLFREKAPVTMTLTTNLRDLLRERDSTALRWFGAELVVANGDPRGRNAAPIATDLRARGHFRRQARNCAFPPLFLRASREARDGTILQGNPRLKVVTPCRPSVGEYQQYILLEYLAYQTYALFLPVHHRTRLVNVTYRDSSSRVDPIAVTAFLLETDEEVADEHGLTFVEQTGALWTDVVPETLDRLSLFEYWIGNTDWSLAALHNVVLFRTADGMHIPTAYDFDWSGLVNTRYSFPNPKLGIRRVRDRLHRGPCRTAEQWAPTIEHFKSRRAAYDSVWAASVPGLEPKRRDEAKAWLDGFWEVLDDPRRFKREIVDQCQPHGN